MCLTAAITSPQHASPWQPSCHTLALSLFALSKQPAPPLPVAWPRPTANCSSQPRWHGLCSPSTRRARAAAVASSQHQQWQLCFRSLSRSLLRRSLAAHSFRRKKQCPPTVPTVCPELNGSRSLFRCATVSCFWDQVSRHPFLARLPHPSSTPSCTASSPVQFFPQSRLYGRGRHARHPFLALQSLSLALPPARSSLSCLSSHIC